jgi:hypothetical protein
MSKDEIVAELKKTLEQRNTVDELTEQADTREAELDAKMIELGYDANELMTRAYAL